MKSFICKIGLFGIICIVLSISLYGVRRYLNSNADWSIPQEKHILVMGASQIVLGFDDSMSKEAYNIASRSERYMYTYLKLKYLLRDNPQVDTILLECAPTDLWQHTDDKYHIENEQLAFVPLFLPIMGREELAIFRTEPLQVISIFVKSLASKKYYKSSSYITLQGGFIEEKQSLDTAQVIPHPIEGERGWTTNYKYLHKIIALCKEHNVRLYFVYGPMYHPEYFYDQDFYYQAYNREFSEVELLDYSHWPVPYDEMFDAHHLNQKGARRFTLELMRRLDFE